MFKPTVVLATLAALSGFSFAAPVDGTCTVGQLYCGGSLLSTGGPTFQTWKATIDAALTKANQPTDSDHEYSSLFRCTGAVVGSDSKTIEYVEYCKTAPNRSCQPPQSNACKAQFPGTPNDCCGFFG